MIHRDQVVDDQDELGPRLTPRPWMQLNGRGWLLCEMCPMDKTTHKGQVQYYRGINTRTRKRDSVRRWVYHHMRCGFEGLR